jgi:small-conductance mechanosensitive channel
MLDTIVFGTVTVLDLMIFALTILVAFVISRIVGIYLKKSLSDHIQKTELAKLIRVVQAAIILIGVYLGLPSFDVHIADLLIVGGTAGLVLAFATQKIASNFGSGIFLLAERPVKIGDNIRIEDISGAVEEIHILSTIVRTDDGVYVRIPNEKVFTSDIINYMANPARRFEYVLRIGYDHDTALAVRVITGLLEAHPYVLAHPGPAVFVSALEESGVQMKVQGWAPSPVYGMVRNELLGSIKSAMQEQGIETPSPRVRITGGEW